MVAAESLFDVGSMVGLLVALVFYIISIATSYWISASGGHFGPTEDCVTGFGCCSDSNNSSQVSACSYMQGIEACVILAIIFSALALLMAFARFKIHRKSTFFAAPSDKVKTLFPVFVFLAGLFGLIAMAIWVNKFGAPSPSSYGYSFALEVVAWIIDMVLGVLIVVAFNN